MLVKVDAESRKHSCGGVSKTSSEGLESGTTDGASIFIKSHCMGVQRNGTVETFLTQATAQLRSKVRSKNTKTINSVES